MATEGEKLSAYFEENSLTYDNKLNTEYDFISTTADRKLPVKGKIIVSNYHKFKSDDTHEEKAGYVWREWTVTFTISDTNANNYGYGWGTGFADYYQGFIDASVDENGKMFWPGKSTGDIYEDTLIVNIDGVDYETYIKTKYHATKWSANTVTAACTMTWLSPVEYDSGIVYVYSGKLLDNAETMEEFTKDIQNDFMFFKLD